MSTPAKPMSPGRQGVLVWAIVSLVLQGVSIPVLKALFGGTALGPSQGLDLLWIFLATVPLAGGVAIVTYMLQNAARTGQGVGWQGPAAVAVGSLFVGTWLAREGYQQFFIDHSRMGVPLPPGAPDPSVLYGSFPQKAVQAVALYFVFYGPALFFSSCLVGWMFGHFAERAANEPNFDPELPKPDAAAAREVGNFLLGGDQDKPRG